MCITMVIIKGLAIDVHNHGHYKRIKKWTIYICTNASMRGEV